MRPSGNPNLGQTCPLAHCLRSAGRALENADECLGRPQMVSGNKESQPGLQQELVGGWFPHQQAGYRVLAWALVSAVG